MTPKIHSMAATASVISWMREPFVDLGADREPVDGGNPPNQAATTQLPIGENSINWVPILCYIK